MKKYLDKFGINLALTANFLVLPGGGKAMTKTFNSISRKIAEIWRIGA